MQRTAMLVALLATGWGCRAKVARPEGYRVPSPEFSIEAAAPVAALGPVSSLTFDSRGRPVVVKEPHGLATRLLDQNGDGVFETERVLSKSIRGVRGLWFDARTLYLLGSQDNQYGLYRLEDRDNNTTVDPPRVELLAALEAPAPGAHQITRGPDGKIELLHGGRWWQWSETRRVLTPVAGGFANARALAFEAVLEAFVLDAGRVDSSAPLLSAPTGPRLLHAIPGGEYAAPGDRLDTLPALEETSVTAIAFYQHDVYPEDLRGALFEADPAQGRLVARRWRRTGATFQPGSARTEFVTGAGRLAINSLAVGPDGFVYFAAAGPGGGLYRLRYTPGWRERWQRWRSQAGAGPTAITRQPQPLSSWGHAALARQHDYLEARWGDELEALARNATAVEADRVQAILLLIRFGPKPKPALLLELLGVKERGIRAAAMRAAAELRNSSANELARDGLADADPLVRRLAAEAVGPEVDANPYPLLKDASRPVRFAARRALEQAPRQDWRAAALAETDPPVALAGFLALLHTAGGPQEAAERAAVVDHALTFAADPNLSEAIRLDALRVLELAWENFTDAELARRATTLLLPPFQATEGVSEPMKRALATVLARLGGGGNAEVAGALIGALQAAETNRPLQAHYARCASTIHNGWDAAQKETMLAWFGRANGWSGAGTAFGLALREWFAAFTASALTHAEARQAQRRSPELAGAASGGLAAEEIFETQLAQDPPSPGPPAQGTAVFAQRCASCHAPGGKGIAAGPDLTGVAERLGKEALLEAILWPSRKVEERYRSQAFELADGSVLEAMLLREDSRVLLMKTPGQPRPISILKRRVKSRRTLDESIMPEGVLDGLDQRAIASLLAFLGVNPAPPR